jgi:transposase
MTIIRFGIDLAKNSFAICGVDPAGKIGLRKTLKREKLLEFFANRAPTMVAMEAGSGAHHWARELIVLGHDARIIDPRLVAPYRHSGRAGKNDFNDAVAICEAAGRPQMRFIPVKSKDQQAILLVHRLRQACVAEHTRLVNRLRGFLAEFGIVVPKGANTFKDRWPVIRQRHDQDLPALAWETLDALYGKLRELHLQVLAYDRQINAFVRQDERAKRLAQVNGIGPITASAIVATIGNGHDFRNGRQFAAWLGLVPRQHSTGGVERLAASPSGATRILEPCSCTAPAVS